MIRVLTGAAGVLTAQALLHRALLRKFRGDVDKLNAGDHLPLLAAYADDAVLRFTPGDHRWAGDHRGTPAIERFLRDFTAAGVQGEIKELYLGGPPWALTMAVRFDDGAAAADGTPLYANRTVLVLKTRWGRIVDHEDFYVDTTRILDFEQELRRRGVAPVAA